MNPLAAAPPPEPQEEIASLVRTLLATERRLVELTGGEVDAVTDGEGGTFLLRRAQEGLRLAEAGKQAAILNALPAHVALLDALGRIISVNEGWRRFAEINSMRHPDHGVGMNYLDVCDQAQGPGSAEAGPVAAGLRSVIDGAAPSFSIEYPCHSPAGPRWFLLTLAPLAGENPHGVVAMHLDITERKLGMEALRVSETRFKALFEQAAVGVAQTDATSGRVLQINRRFCEILGRDREEMEGLTFAAITHPDDAARSLEMREKMKAGDLREFTHEKRYVRKDGSEVWANVTFSAMWAPGEAPDYILSVGQDISERKHLEDQFRQAQKMEAIGTLAGGIAHDFNNILAAIRGYTELALMVLEDNPKVRLHLGTVLTGAGRAVALVRQILTFSRQQPLERRPIQLLPVVAESLMLLRATIPSTIEFETSLPSNAPGVLADSSQVHQILMNLGTNAWHAMKDRTGLLKVTLERHVVAPIPAHAGTQPGILPGPPPGVYARISVSDTGAGMDQATLRRIFEPYFTTKSPGEGTGLGLSVVHGIMDSHDGAITVQSQPGKGTVFQLYFPEHIGAEHIAAPESGPVPRGQGERILFVDDEDLLVQLGRESLETLGYQVEGTTHPAEALALVSADPSRFALVITDQTMPKMTGVQLAGRLRQIRPDLPVILTTGYNQSVAAEGAGAVGVRQLLLKPCTLHLLGTAVHAALRSPA